MKGFGAAHSLTENSAKEEKVERNLQVTSNSPPYAFLNLSRRRVTDEEIA